MTVSPPLVSPPRTMQILLVEDSPTDRLITQTALQNSRLPNTVHTVSNGLDALAFLRREGKYADAPTPDLILLDINMPRLGGREVLSEIKGDFRLRRIPVVVLTTSAAPDDILDAYAAHANSYITKPVDFAKFNEALQVMEHYWFEVVALPPSLPPAAGADGARPAEEAAPAERITILVVEDSPTDVLLLKNALETVQPGTFAVTHVARIQEAIPMLERRQFDVIITDLTLPDAAGLDAVLELRRVAGNMPILVLTAGSDDAKDESAIKLGAEDVLRKDELQGPTISRAIRYAIQRRDARVQLVQRQRVEAVGMLATSVAHDFNNLLAVIAASAELLLGPVPASEAGAVLTEILQTAERGRALTGQLLAFSRRDRFEPTTLDLNEVVTSVAGLLRRLAGDRMALHLELQSELPYVHADLRQLEQALLNIGVNANDAMPAGGVLTIATEGVSLDAATAAAIDPALRPGLYARITLRDNGVGVPPELHDQIFKPFFTTKAKGTGLGLATVVEIVEQHGGTVLLESTVGAGSIFTMYLPASADASPVPAAPLVAVAPNPAEPVVHRGATILLAEDEPAVRRSMERILQRHGFHILSADSGAAAWDIWSAERDRIDVIISDLLMPGPLQAMAFAARVKAERPEMPIVFCSGFSETFADTTTTLVEGENFLAKPFSVQGLLGIVTRALA